jgi:hypothetical protein
MAIIIPKNSKIKGFTVEMKKSEARLSLTVTRRYLKRVGSY